MAGRPFTGLIAIDEPAPRRGAVYRGGPPATRELVERVGGGRRNLGGSRAVRGSALERGRSCLMRLPPLGRLRRPPRRLSSRAPSAPTRRDVTLTGGLLLGRVSQSSKRVGALPLSQRTALVKGRT